jgi:hypothetical protein
VLLAAVEFTNGEAPGVSLRAAPGERSASTNHLDVESSRDDQT